MSTIRPDSKRVRSLSSSFDISDGGLSEVERVYKELIPVYRQLADITLRNDQGYHMAVYTLTRIIRERF